MTRRSFFVYKRVASVGSSCWQATANIVSSLAKLVEKTTDIGSPVHVSYRTPFHFRSVKRSSRFVLHDSPASNESLIPNKRVPSFLKSGDRIKFGDPVRVLSQLILSGFRSAVQEFPSSCDLRSQNRERTKSHSPSGVIAWLVMTSCICPETSHSSAKAITNENIVDPKELLYMMALYRSKLDLTLLTKSSVENCTMVQLRRI